MSKRKRIGGRADSLLCLMRLSSPRCRIPGRSCEMPRVFEAFEAGLTFGGDLGLEGGVAIRRHF